MPSKATVIVGFAVAAAIGVIFMSPVVSAVNQNTGVQSVTNETVTADYNASADLAGYDVDAGSVTVYGLNETSGHYETATEPDDYELRAGPGEVDFNESSTLINEGEDVRVTYDYTATSGTTTLIIGFIPVMLGTLILTVIARGVQDRLQV